MKKTAQKNDTFDFEEFRQGLKLKHLQTKADFTNKYKTANKALASRGMDIGKLREHSTKLLTTGAMAGALLLAPVDTTKLLPPAGDIIHNINHDDNIPVKSPAVVLREALKQILPDQIRPLSRDEEKTLEQAIKETTGIPAKASLEGEHLNTTYGKIGAEQHLRRYPGDINENHAPQPEDYGGDDPSEILKEGMAPGLGAWGYFAPNKESLSPDLVETEKWYAVVQTLYLPDWNTRTKYLRDWYKYRKVIIVNTDNGKAVVAAVADSGPAAWTGKHFGGSPEVMDYLGGPRYKKGPVILFFVDDPENTIPLGPVEYNNI